jgi:hypothetical protein
MKIYGLAFLLLAGSVPAISDDLEDSFGKLKEAEARKDVALVKQLAVETCALARKEAAQPAPEKEEQKEWWTKHLVYLQGIETYTEYALYTTAMQAPAASAVDLFATLEQQNPKSKYLDEAYGRYFLALNQTGAAAKIPAIAEQALKNFPENEDLLVVLADNAMNRKQTDRALQYAERVISVLGKHRKPEGMPAADWERKRTLAIGRTRWIAGICHAEKAQHFEADKDLRAALPLIAGNDAMMASALFYLGLANYQLGATMREKPRILEAAKFSEQAAAIKGPLSQQAWRNAQAMRAEAQKMK